jgi:hypothetical protein
MCANSISRANQGMEDTGIGIIKKKKKCYPIVKLKRTKARKKTNDTNHYMRQP